MYADDTKVYTILNHNTRATIIPKLEACLNDIKVWSSRNGLKLYQQKTEFLHLSSKFRSKSSLQPITIVDSSLDPTSHARDLGVIIDDQLTMAKHVSNLCRASSFGLHKIGKIRQYLDQSTTEKLIHAFVMSRIDNNNSLLYGLPECQLHKLQRVQNSAARLITRTRSLEPITPILRNLHWLPVKSRIVFKLLTLTYKCKNGSAPDYLQDLIQHYHPPRTLRSSSKGLLIAAPVHTKFYGQRSFQYASPKLWNSLPNNLKDCATLEQFKSRLKTHLFNHRSA